MKNIKNSDDSRTGITNENLQWYLNQPVELQLELFKHFVDVAKILANQLFEDEVKSKAKALKYITF